MTNQKGFTLIELMIVVAIIGILASVAIPQYAVYIGRSEFGSAVSACDELKSAVGEYVATKGTGAFTVAELQTFRPDLVGAVAADYSGKYTTGCTIADGGTITATTVATGITAALAGQDIVLTPNYTTDAGGSDRLSSWTAVTLIDAKYIPEALR